MKWWLALALPFLSLTNFCECNTGCHILLGDNHRNDPLILEKVGSRYKFVQVNSSRSIFLENDQQVIVTCQSQSLGFCTDNFGSVLLRCKQNQPFISIDGKVVPYCPSKYKLECEAPVIQHYAYPVEGCDKSNIGVVAGYVNRIRTNNPKNSLVKVMEYCYSPRSKKVYFAHFKALSSLYLDLQYPTNVGESFLTDLSILRGDVEPINVYDFGPNLGLLGLPSPHGNGLVVGYRASLELIPHQYTTAISQSSLNVFAEWDILREENWNRVVELQRALTRRFIVDIYSGTTNRQVSNQSQPILRNSRAPIYKWNLVQLQPSSAGYQTTVLVAINIPNLPQSEVDRYIFCDDVCDTISWLAPLGPERTNTSNGYVFCCSVEEASRKIAEFPLNYGQGPTTLTTSRTIIRNVTRTTRRTVSRTTRSFPIRTTRRTVRRTVIATRRTTFAPFPCKEVLRSNAYGDALSDLINTDDIVTHSADLELPQLESDEETLMYDEDDVQGSSAEMPIEKPSTETLESDSRSYEVNQQDLELLWGEDASYKNTGAEDVSDIY